MLSELAIILLVITAAAGVFIFIKLRKYKKNKPEAKDISHPASEFASHIYIPPQLPPHSTAGINPATGKVYAPIPKKASDKDDEANEWEKQKKKKTVGAIISNIFRPSKKNSIPSVKLSPEEEQRRADLYATASAMKTTAKAQDTEHPQASSPETITPEIITLGNAQPTGHEINSHMRHLWDRTLRHQKKHNAAFGLAEYLTAKAIHKHKVHSAEFKETMKLLHKSAKNSDAHHTYVVERLIHLAEHFRHTNKEKSAACSEAVDILKKYKEKHHKHHKDKHHKEE